MEITGGKHREVDETVKLIEDIDAFGIKNMDNEDYDYINGLVNDLHDYVDYMEMTINNLENSNNVSKLNYYNEKHSLLTKYIKVLVERSNSLLNWLKGEGMIETTV